ncbi:hypothetical protein [Lysinibacillus sp. fls2-241-R2A-57]|uniref:hypothetical protein n=1 Tax=Lysinibacillus sp. fls2-241-R2A-57 TaxID=3040292 RepID=UPI00255511C2|nr:hypothetical protein [Lysinibacillus sp. fls2-241-R2A-57]
MKKILTTILFSSSVLFVPHSILTQENNTEVSSNKITPQELEEYQEHMVNELMEKYNATDGTAILYDNQGNIIHAYKTISRGEK